VAGEGGMGVAEGMQSLLAQRTAELESGAHQVGWKIGLNALPMQQHFGLSGPVVGYLLSPTLMEAKVPVDISGWAVPALEVEVAIRVGADGNVAGLAPALELVDLGDFFDEIGLILQANVCHRGVIFGDEVDGVDVKDLQVRVESAAGEERATGALLEDPAAAIRVVREFLGAHGATLSEGDRIIAGSLITPLRIAPGEEVTVSFGALGNLSARFS
jgi:2-keto-4-pentenoate hydratase